VLEGECTPLELLRLQEPQQSQQIRENHRQTQANRKNPGEVPAAQTAGEPRQA